MQRAIAFKREKNDSKGMKYEREEFQRRNKIGIQITLNSSKKEKQFCISSRAPASSFAVAYATRATLHSPF